MKKSSFRKGAFAVALALTIALFSGCELAGKNDDGGTKDPLPVKNVILLINDGASNGAWDAAEYWENGRLGNLSYSSYPVKVGMTTFPLNMSNTPTSNNDQVVTYDPAQAWDTTPSAEGLPFAGYNYIGKNATDSAAAGTAIAAGVKTYNNAINYDNQSQALTFITQVAKEEGRVTGVVSSVDFSHATPATFGAQNISRNNYTAIAHHMLINGELDLIMGGGHPLYDAEGALRAEPWYGRISKEDFDQLKAGSLVNTGSGKTWNFIETKSDFENLSSAATVALPLIGIPQIASTLQQGRTLAVQGADASNPTGIKHIPTVPTLATMTKGALKALSQHQGGFFLMIEGGATDCAAHGKQAGQLIEETLDFNASVAAVNAWVEAHSNWEETLVIVTTDHGNAMVFGPEANTQAFHPVKNNGKGVMPGMTFQTGSHTNEVVRLWAKGGNAASFNTLATGVDPGFATYFGYHTPTGAYCDNTDVFKVMKAALLNE